MIYRFMGVYREQLWFATPNLAGCFLVMIIMLCIGLAISLVKQKNIYSKVGAIIPASVAILAEFLLVCSYSRGGYVAFVVGILALIWFTRSRWLWLFGGSFALFLLVVENGATRVGTMGELADGSILHRFLLWQGGMAMIADNFNSGVDSNFGIGGEYTAWFQPLWLNERYHLLLNDFLNATAIWGIWISGAILLGFIAILFWGWQTQRKTKSDLLAGLLSSIITFIVCSMFSSMAFHKYLFLWMAVGGLAIILIWSAVYAIITRWWQWRNIWIPLATTSTICLLFMIACHIVRAGYPYQYSTIELTNNHAIVVTPNESKGSIVMLVEEKDDLLDAIRNEIRPFVDLGYQVYFAKVDSGLNGLQSSKEFLQYICNTTDAPLIMLMTETAGKQLFIATAENPTINIAKVIIYNIPETWPFEELSPLNFANKLTSETIIIKESPEQLQLLQDTISNHVEVVMVKDKTEYKSYLRTNLE